MSKVSYKLYACSIKLGILLFASKQIFGKTSVILFNSSKTFLIFGSKASAKSYSALSICLSKILNFFSTAAKIFSNDWLANSKFELF